MKNKFLHALWSMAFRSGVVGLLSDKIFTCIMYYCYTGKRLDLNNPKDFNQKIQWLKLYYRNKEYVKCADKFAVREYVEEKIGKKYLNNCLGIYNNVNDICFEHLPARFVLKATHASGWNIVCSDKSKLNWRIAKEKMWKWLRSDFSKVGREWQYHEIKPRIICEEFMEEADGSPLIDYKLFTFKGETKYIAVEFDEVAGGDTIYDIGSGHTELNRQKGVSHHINFYDCEWRFCNDKEGSAPPLRTACLEKPRCLDEMLDIARRLSSDFPMCRVDLYVLNGNRIIFGELTFTPGKGCNTLTPDSFADELGDYIELPVIAENGK